MENSIEAPPQTATVNSLIDEAKVSWAQVQVIILCSLVMFLDGLDTQTISYVAPVISKEMSIPTALLGPIFSAALAGLMVGYLLLAPLSEKWGHRPVLLTATAGFGLLTIGTAFATNITEIAVLRFFTGIALGAAVPSTIAMTTEYTPRRLRASFVLLIYCGFSLGFVAAGALAAALIPSFGWRSLLWVCGLAPLLVSAAGFLLLPESLDFLVRTGKPDQTAKSILAKMRIGADRIPTVLTVEEKQPGSSIASLFKDGHALGTIGLWLVFILNLGLFYALQSWLPTILTRGGFSLPVVATTTSLTTIGGIVVALVMGPAMDRIGPYVSLAALYFLGVISVALLGNAIGGSIWALYVISFLAGVSVSGGQKSVIALSAVFYPAPIRSTGVGWALGIGRLGGIGGPILLGWLVNSGQTNAHMFYLCATLMLLCGLLIAALGKSYGVHK